MSLTNDQRGEQQKHTHVTIGPIDLALLLDQRDLYFRLAEGQELTREEMITLDGLVELIDHIVDECEGWTWEGEEAANVRKETAGD